MDKGGQHLALGVASPLHQEGVVLREPETGARESVEGGVQAARGGCVAFRGGACGGCERNIDRMGLHFNFDVVSATAASSVSVF